MRMNILHVYPADDLVLHITEGWACTCGPRVEWTDDGCIVIHNAWDERL